jgi:hypothetical protein
MSAAAAVSANFEKAMQGSIDLRCCATMADLGKDL